MMEQRIESLSAKDLANIEVGRQWVRDHFMPESRNKYEQVSEKLRLLQDGDTSVTTGLLDCRRLQNLKTVPKPLAPPPPVVP